MNNVLPKDPVLGEMIAFPNRVIMIWVGNQWYLLGGEGLSLIGYNKAVAYLLDAWGETSQMIEEDLNLLLEEEPNEYLKEVFVTRCVDANNLFLAQMPYADQS